MSRRKGDRRKAKKTTFYPSALKPGPSMMSVADRHQFVLNGIKDALICPHALQDVLINQGGAVRYVVEGAVQARCVDSDRFLIDGKNVNLHLLSPTVRPGEVFSGCVLGHSAPIAIIGQQK
jgi:hypothetical protein